MEIILVGHAHTAKAFKEAVEMIYGEVPNFHPIDFTPKEGLQSLTDKIVSAIEPGKTASTLIITDLFSGTPYNASAELVLKKKAADVVAGMCLPMLLEVAVNANNCLLYTSDAADDLPCVDIGGRRIIKKKTTLSE